MNPIKVLLAGYYGCQNLGDEALLMALLKNLSSLPVLTTVLSGNPEKTTAEYGVCSVDRMDMARVCKAIRTCDILIFGGGSLFQDASSLKSLCYYAFLSQFAEKSRKKVVFLGQGVGPLKSPLGRRIAALAFRCGDLITVRDSNSAKLLQKIGVKNSIYITSDLVYSLREPASEDQIRKVQPGSKVGIIPRPLKDVPDSELINVFVQLTLGLIKEGYNPCFIAMDAEMDLPFVKKIIEEVKCLENDSLFFVETVRMLLDLLLQFDGVISMRLHGGILSALMGARPYFISYDPKVEACAELMGLNFGLRPLELDVDQVIRFFQESDFSHFAKALLSQKTMAQDNFKELEHIIEDALKEK